jgi:DHA1 family multidrug resistance protein-like MFS transporter
MECGIQVSTTAAASLHSAHNDFGLKLILTVSSSSVHWIVPTIAGACLATCLLLIFVGYLNYLVDTYLMYAASAIAANTIARSACGAAAPLFTNQMFDALGVGGGGSLIGGVAAVLAIIPFWFYKYGKAIRIRSKFAPTKEKEQLKTKDEEQGLEALTDQATRPSGVPPDSSNSEGVLGTTTDSSLEHDTEVEDGTVAPGHLQEKKQEV